MKRLWISAIIFVLLLTVCFFGATKTHQISSGMAQTISSAKKAANGGNMDNAFKLSQKAVNDWHGYHKVLCTFMSHDRLEKIDQTLSELPMLSYYGSNDQFAADCDQGIAQINYLNESEFANLANIF